jgi:hypothetical protein
MFPRTVPKSRQWTEGYIVVRIVRKVISEICWRGCRVNEGDKRELCGDDRKFFVPCTKKVSNCLSKI